ncbi:fimbrial protein [Serratia entomophila]|uniref:fimbrial protein n=1 Tax=Serratia entomophila TaxID=42906 RepID=UPI002177CB9E|nr:fimbrial protein [Serratia entomophila]CAI1057864.1 Fimbria A protein precursor [Serratia entomophila]CAI1065026.1 Fimbria A protein precursor [Serratia entomophila]CAI1141140.1 Fimbria A protein precursor [Serratia entomophila]CAI1888122.1 Fimbria A protein precursor [Serratia entomophila]CAI1917519.1 Fimbria A protein precursor [Serratia entomophila]
MKLNKIMMAAVIAFGASSLAHAADQGHGTVTFTGSIIDAPCSIAPETADQTVDLGQVSNVALKDGGKSTPRNFSISLENCELTTDKEGKNNTVSLTFTGMESAANNGLLGITGTAQGASIAITDGTGAVIELGKPTKAQALQDGNNALNFAAYLQGDSASSAVVPGDFQAVADFTLAYQ